MLGGNWVHLDPHESADKRRVRPKNGRNTRVEWSIQITAARTPGDTIDSFPDFSVIAHWKMEKGAGGKEAT